MSLLFLRKFPRVLELTLFFAALSVFTINPARAAEEKKPATKQDIKLSAKFERQAMLVGEETVFTVLARWKGLPDDFRFEWPAPNFYNLEVLRKNETAVYPANKKGTIFEKAYKFYVAPKVAGRSGTRPYSAYFFEKLNVERHEMPMREEWMHVFIRPPYYDQFKPFYNALKFVVIGGFLLSVFLFWFMRPKKLSPAAAADLLLRKHAEAKWKQAHILISQGKYEVYVQSANTLVQDFVSKKFSAPPGAPLQLALVQDLLQKKQIQSENARALMEIITALEMLNKRVSANQLPDEKECYDLSVRIQRLIKPRSASAKK